MNGLAWYALVCASVCGAVAVGCMAAESAWPLVALIFLPDYNEGNIKI